MASGAIFGGALTLAGVASPTVIVDQFKLTNFHMLVSFMAASACSAICVALSNAYGYVKLGHRKDSSFGWFGMYDGNIVGGTLQGIGMALTGCCPGTVFVQMAAGISTAYWALAGGILGAAVFVKWKETAQIVDARPDTQHTLMQKTGLSTSKVVLAYEMLLLAMIVGAQTMAPQRQYWLNPVIGGLLIGVAQAASVGLSKKTLGVSSAFEEAGKWTWAITSGKTRPGFANITFAGGLIVGAATTMRYAPGTKEAVLLPLHVSVPSAVAGGFAMVFGARSAGGCTSGHGISGMATMAFSSFITVAAMFGAGIGAAAIL
ncbi:uncharacterized protein AB675_5541 [Cyphellophora attinorum]|uniref:Uncharacterized protein n=1 Tax=Cyphellophora attinorum TaxID=1664694 RepID=A0A0N1HT62_9EURO|nr:uncharacterized protein AB675_5541 [Phialophora attinorum]KPI42085.1 hypothetical protein AB675_5541 [Phialophora attinorum]